MTGKQRHFGTSEYEKRGFEGYDASLDISLNEYGLIWKLYKRDNKKKGFVKGEFLFVYINSYGDIDWAGNIHENTDMRKEFPWVDWDKVAYSTDLSVDEFLKQSVPAIIADLVFYYGTVNIFGR